MNLVVNARRRHAFRGGGNQDFPTECTVWPNLMLRDQVTVPRGKIRHDKVSYDGTGIEPDSCKSVRAVLYPQSVRVRATGLGLFHWHMVSSSSRVVIFLWTHRGWGPTSRFTFPVLYKPSKRKFRNCGPPAPLRRCASGRCDFTCWKMEAPCTCFCKAGPLRCERYTVLEARKSRSCTCYFWKILI